MIDLPGSTEVFEQMPKGLFVKHLNNADRLEKNFMDEIISIVLINKLSPERMTICPGEIVTAIAVVEIFLNRQVISQNLLEIVNKEIDQTTVFIARYEGWGQIWCAINQSGNILEAESKVYYQTSWLPYDELELKVAGDDLDQVYENFLIQISEKSILAKNGSSPKDPVKKTAKPAEFEEEQLDEVEKTEKVVQLEATIKVLQTQINHEKQFKRQVKLVLDLKNAKAALLKIKAPPISQIELIQNDNEMNQSFFPHVFVNMTEDDETEFDDSLTDFRILKMR